MQNIVNASHSKIDSGVIFFKVIQKHQKDADKPIILEASIPICRKALKNS